nr:cytochrome p450 CYP3044B3 [Brachionus angularis]
MPEYLGFNTVIFSTGLLGFIIYIFLKWLNMRGYFEKCNIKGPKPLPLVGNFFSIAKHGMPYYHKQLIEKYGKTMGYYEGSTPIILTTDPKLLKLILIKDFSNFTNRFIFEPIQFDPFDKILLFLKDEEWKNIRSILTTVFSSGKLKSMSKLMIECSNRLNEHLVKLEKNDEYLDAREIFGCLSLDIICSCCFGINIDSMNDPDNEVLKCIKMYYLGSLSKDPRMILIILFPSLTKFLIQKNLLTLIPNEPTAYLKAFISKVIERRKQKLERRDDFIQIMVEHEEQVKKELITGQEQKQDLKYVHLKNTLTTEEIFSQAIMFLFGGYENTSIALNLISYNLATNPECQDLLCEEIDKLIEKYGEVNYEMVHEINYMNMVIDETLRMYPPTIRFDRVAGSDYEYEGLKIKKGQNVVVPLWALHHDKEIYPDPEKFIPERFNEENKKLRDNCTYLPFGAGPRNCIGMRFALLEIKFTLATILSKFKFVKCDKTPEIIEIDSSGSSRPKVPIFLKLKNRF